MDQVIVLIGMIVQLGTGFIASKVGAEKLRKFIPTMNFVLALFTQIVASFQAGVPAGTEPTAIHAGFFGDFGKGFLDIFVNSLIQTFVVTGAHSAVKNTQQGIKLGAR